MLKISNKYQCSGCGACADVCPVKCIMYKHDAFGFIYPEIDAAACIGCDSCDRVCPVKPENVNVREPENCYVAWTKDDLVHRASASGGLGHVLACEILERGGIVYGCSAEAPRHICHVRIDDKGELYKLQGSKYVQSDTRGIYKQLKADVLNGKDVLFVGTPCQVSAAKNLFKKVPDNLYTVDLICHGVPPQKMLNEQIDIIGKKLGDIKPVAISFRDNNTFRFLLTYPDNTSVNKDLWSAPYYRAFFKGYSYRPSCYHCQYADSKRVGDITIGDFWGIKNPEALSKESRLGISAVFATTAKGQRLLEAVAPCLDMQRRPVKEAVDGNDQLRHPVRESFRAKLLRVLYPALPIGVAVTICVADKKLVTLKNIIARKIKG